MSIYSNYKKEIQERELMGLNPKPISESILLLEIIEQIKDLNHPERDDSLKFLIFNVTPGTTGAATVKAKFLKDIILSKFLCKEITPFFAFKLLAHMKGGPSIEVLIDLALSKKNKIAKEATGVLKSQVFLYEDDMERLKTAFMNGNKFAKDILKSYANAEFFTSIPNIRDEIEVVTYVAGIGDISTDFLSPGSDAHSRSDRELHGKSIFEHNSKQQNKLLSLKKEHPDKAIMLVAEKGTLGVGSSRMSGVIKLP